MFTAGFMINAMLSATIVGIVAAVVGFFTVLRGATFAAHALPKGGFAGAAGAALIGMNTVLGLAIFTIGGAVSIGLLGKSGRRDVVTALILVVGLGIGALFLDINNVYAPEVFSLLFGEILGVSTGEVMVTAVLALICIAALCILYRPLLFTSVMKDTAEARGIPVRLLDIVFLVILGLATAVTVPIVGALLTFSLLIGPAAASHYLSHHPLRAIAYSITISIVCVWLSLILAYDSGWPLGFFVATTSAVAYFGARFLRFRLVSSKGTE